MEDSLISIDWTQSKYLFSKVSRRDEEKKMGWFQAHVVTKNFDSLSLLPRFRFRVKRTNSWKVRRGVGGNGGV